MFGQKLVARAALVLELLAPRWTQHKRHLRVCGLALPALAVNPGKHKVVYNQGRSGLAQHTWLLEVRLSPPEVFPSYCATPFPTRKSR